MRYFFNIVRSGLAVPDPDGADFDTDHGAELEAHLVARELIGRELIGGRTVDWMSSLEVKREDGTVVTVLSFLEAAQVPQLE